jgi:ABC-2 type transport system permease protein
MTCIAIGQFFSALTENQIVAALITIPVLLGFWFVGHLQTLQSSLLMRDLVAHLSFALHFADFIRGLLRSEGMLYFAAVIATALTLNTSYLQLRR